MISRLLRLCCLLTPLALSAQNPIVKTNQGFIRGIRENDIDVFKGIPYADPPIRYQIAVAHKPWKDTLDTKEFGSASIQPGEHDVHGSENCLFLNLYTPDTDNKKRAVMVWVHGGGMMAGTGSSENGHAFADHDDIVTVTINYRLGALGFLYLGDIDPKYTNSANLGLLDILAALKWVKENISSFGGDPERVTVMGQSAGAKLLSAVMVSPASQGLFKQAILESGSIQCIRDKETAIHTRALLLHQLGIGLNDINKLLTIPAEDLIKAQAVVCAGPGGISFFGPVYDGETIPEDGYQYAREGKVKDVTAMMGSNEQEAAAFVNEKTYAEGVFEPVFRSNSPMARDYYHSLLKTKIPYSALVQTLTQYMYEMHTYRFAKVLSDAGGMVWVYQYRYQDYKPLGARHGDEMHYIWDATHIAQTDDDPVRKQLAKTLHGAWVSFIRTANPNGGSLPEWTTYNSQNHPVMFFDSENRLAHLKEVYDDKKFPSPVFVIK